MHVLITLVIIGGVITIALTLFQLAASVVFAAIAGIFVAIGALFNKLK